MIIKRWIFLFYLSTHLTGGANTPSGVAGDSHVTCLANAAENLTTTDHATQQVEHTDLIPGYFGIQLLPILTKLRQYMKPEPVLEDKSQQG